MMPFLSGSARNQTAATAGNDTTDAAFGPAAFDGSVLLMPLAGLGVMVLLFCGSVKVSHPPISGLAPVRRADSNEGRRRPEPAPPAGRLKRLGFPDHRAQ